MSKPVSSKTKKLTAKQSAALLEKSVIARMKDEHSKCTLASGAVLTSTEGEKIRNMAGSVRLMTEALLDAGVTPDDFLSPDSGDRKEAFNLLPAEERAAKKAAFGELKGFILANIAETTVTARDKGFYYGYYEPVLISESGIKTAVSKVIGSTMRDCRVKLQNHIDDTPENRAAKKKERAEKAAATKEANLKKAAMTGDEKAAAKIEEAIAFIQESEEGQLTFDVPSVTKRLKAIAMECLLASKPAIASK